MTNWLKGLLVLALVFGLAACASAPKGGPGAEQGGGAQAPGAETGAQPGAEDQRAGANLGQGFAGSPLEDPNSPLATRVIYFDFDSSEIRPDQRATVDAHTQYLASHPDQKVVLEGHTDERGSREYNMALGERRAKAVQQVMLLQGVGADQIKVISYGEERPVAMGHDESAWQLNRRVELVYPGH